MTPHQPSRDRRHLEFTVVEAALIAEVSPITVRMWIARGHIRRNAHGLIDGYSLLDYIDDPNRAHGQHRGWRPPE